MSHLYQECHLCKKSSQSASGIKWRFLSIPSKKAILPTKTKRSRRRPATVSTTGTSSGKTSGKGRKRGDRGSKDRFVCSNHFCFAIVGRNMTGTASASARSSGSVQVEDGVDESENDDDNDDHTENENNDESERDHDSEHDDVGVPVESTKSQSGLHDSESDGKRSAADTDSAIAIPIANGTDSSTTVVASTNTSASTSSSIENGAAISNGDHEPAQDGEPNDVTTTSAGFHCIESLDESVNLLDYVREHNTTLKFPEKVSDRPHPRTYKPPLTDLSHFHVAFTADACFDVRGERVRKVWESRELHIDRMGP